MTSKDIVLKLSLTYPSDVLFAITMETVITAIVRRMGEEALELSAEDLKLARDEVRAAIEHHDPARDLPQDKNLPIIFYCRGYS